MGSIQFVRDENGNLTGVLVPIDLWNILKEEIREETEEILNNPELMKAIKASKADIKAGRMTTLDSLETELGCEKNW